jgi:hypothetical protein
MRLRGIATIAAVLLPTIVAGGVCSLGPPTAVGVPAPSMATGLGAAPSTDRAHRSLSTVRVPARRGRAWRHVATVAAGTVRVTATPDRRCARARLRLVQDGRVLGADQGPGTLVGSVAVRAGRLRIALSTGCRGGREVRIETSPRHPARGAAILAQGAAGDGVTDDGPALQRTLDRLRPGDTLVLPAGRTYAHDDVLVVQVPGVTITGGGTLLATDEERSEVLIAADDVLVDGVTFRVGPTTRRWSAYEQMKLRIGPTSGVTLRDVTVLGAAAAGVYVGGASRFRLEHVTVVGTRADGIHITGASTHGQVVKPVVRRTGDDGIAVVSYVADRRPVRDITIPSPRFYGQSWGRAFSVVGGSDIVYRDVLAEDSAAASIYIAAESSFDTMAARRVLFAGGVLRFANQQHQVAHGAVLVHNGQSEYVNADITVRDVRIIGTHQAAPWQVGIVSDEGALQERISLVNLTMTRGAAPAFHANVDPAAYRRAGWSWVGPPS